LPPRAPARHDLPQDPERMAFFFSLLIEGALAGALYALSALAFVVVYKASRVINFALGEWLMLSALLVTGGLHAFALDLATAMAMGCVGMFVVAIFFNVLVLQHLVGKPAIALLMVTLGVGALMRGSAQLLFPGVPGRIQLPIPTDPIILNDLSVPSDRLIAALIAALLVALIAWVHQRSRAGVALRAIADDQQVAMAVGINVHRHLLIVWCLAGVVCVLAATLWTSVTGSSFGLALVGLKILPIVIIGGLDSIPGTIIAAVFIGVLESFAGGYLDPKLGGACGPLASYLALIAVLFVRPFGLFGREQVQRV